MSKVDASTTSMARENPRFTHIERAPYELGHLLKALPPDLSSFSNLTAETAQIVDAAAAHAYNANYTLMCGLEAIGNLMFVAGANEEYSIEKGTLAELGRLISHVAVEAQFLQETEDDLTFIHREHLKRQGERSASRKDENAPSER